MSAFAGASAGLLPFAVVGFAWALSAGTTPRPFSTLTKLRACHAFGGGDGFGGGAGFAGFAGFTFFLGSAAVAALFDFFVLESFDCLPFLSEDPDCCCCCCRLRDLLLAPLLRFCLFFTLRTTRALDSPSFLALGGGLGVTVFMRKNTRAAPLAGWVGRSFLDSRYWFWLPSLRFFLPKLSLPFWGMGLLRLTTRIDCCGFRMILVSLFCDSFAFGTSTNFSCLGSYNFLCVGRLGRGMMRVYACRSFIPNEEDGTCRTGAGLWLGEVTGAELWYSGGMSCSG